MNKIHTIGYGNDLPEKFLERLKAAGITQIIDIRRSGSKSWCSSYNWGRKEGLSNLLRSQSIGRIQVPMLANYYDTLDAYKKWLDSEGQNAVKLLVANINETGAFAFETMCLLCSEDCPFDAIGRARCHRVYVADKLVEMLGDGWKVEHL